MSPKKQVPTLNYLCIKLIRDKLIEALSDDQNRHFDAITAYISEVTHEVCQDLLRNILNSENLDAATRFNSLRVLLRRDVTRLDTGIFPHSYYEAILKVIARQGTGLQQLNLKGVWARDHPALLSDLVRSLSKLKVLVIPHMPDDSVLEAVTSCCRCLNVLDISGECSFTVAGLRQLRSGTIKVLDIGNFGKDDICRQVLAHIIENLPELTRIQVYSFTGSALLLSHQKNDKYRTKLKYLHDTGTTLDIMHAIIDMCPNLESIHLDTPQKNVIVLLGELQRLNSVKLTKHDHHDFLLYLKQFGDRLQVLKLNHNKTAPLDLSDICLYAPNLITLELFHMKVTFPNSETFFMTLQDVEILYCDISDHSLKCILLNSPFLKRMVVGCVVTMTDGDMFRLCSECEFVWLEELWISCARGLTLISVELLMEQCPNLKMLGQLSGWDIHQDEVDYLRAVITYTNADLTLLPLGPL